MYREEGEGVTAATPAITECHIVVSHTLHNNSHGISGHPALQRSVKQMANKSLKLSH